MDFPGNKALKATLPADEVTPAILPHVGEATAKRWRQSCQLTVLRTIADRTYWFRWQSHGCPC